MAIIHNFVIWNNKGGVGKSTITFHLASRYAELHPDENVIVVDMCPQANSSMMLLGGGATGENNVLKYCTEQTPKTVVGYITSVIAGGSGASRPNPIDYIVDVHTVNNKLPYNLHLLCGDGNLEPISSAIVAYANMQPIVQDQQPWVWVHSIIKSFISDYSHIGENDDRNTSVFIDTNPAFGVYTELAMIASEKLICPVNADDSSRTAASALAILLHGSNPPHPVYGAWTFAAKAKQFDVQIPKIHMLVGNRFTQYSGAATAFRAMSEATSNQMYELYERYPDYFSPSTLMINNINDFVERYSIFLRDFNTSGVVASHTGCLLSHMHGGTYKVYGSNVTLDSHRIAECLNAIDAVINKF